MNIAIIGAGAAGLSAAFDLVNGGHSVTVFEAGAVPGGLASGFKLPNWESTVERLYHHWFASDADLLKLTEELGVREKVIFKSPTTVSYYDGKFYPLDSPVAVLKFPGMPFPARVRFGAAVGVLKYLINNGLSLEKDTAHDWCRKWMGETAYNAVVQPILSSKFGEEYYRQVNMAWLWARFKSRTFQLGTFEGGFQAFFDLFVAQLTAKGAKLRFGARVDQIAQADGQWRVTIGAEPAQQFDRVLVTTSPRLMTRLAPELPKDYLGALDNLKSLGAIVMIVALKQPLSPQGYYWHSLSKKDGFPYLTLCEHTNFVDKAKFGGQTLVYVGDYLPASHEYFTMAEDELKKIYIGGLARFNPEFKPDWVQNVWTFREAYAQPVPFVNHSRNIPATRTPLPGLFFASMSQVYPWDRGTNFAVKIGRDVAREMMAAPQP